ncbi:hypothetical protein ACHAXT_011394 [Thalassiosira profunda]
MERMHCLGVSIERGIEDTGKVDGGLPERLVSLLEDASTPWSAFVASVRDDAPPRMCESAEVASLHRTLYLLSSVSRMDPTLGEEIARAGTQPICTRLIQQINKCRAIIGEDCISDEDSDALIDMHDVIFEIYSPSSVQGLAFTDEELRGRLPLLYKLTPVPQCIQSRGYDESSNGGEHTTIFIRQVTKRQSAQADVGFVMWPSAIVLSRWVLSKPHVLKGKSVLELGAGCGLVGIVAARLISQGESESKEHAVSQQRVMITDVNELVLENISQNIELNDVASVASVAKLDFYEQTGDDSGKWLAGEMNGVTASGREQVDIILAADIICQPEDAVAASKTIIDALKPGGLALVVCANSEHRFGVEIFVEECQKRGLEVRTTDVTEMFDGALLTEQMESSAGYVDGMELSFFEVGKRE